MNLCLTLKNKFTNSVFAFKNYFIHKVKLLIISSSHKVQSSLLHLSNKFQQSFSGIKVYTILYKHNFNTADNI